MGLVPLKTKGQAKDAVIKVLNEWAAKKGRRATILRSDRGMRYTGKAWPNRLRDNGIENQSTTRGSQRDATAP